MVSRSCVPMATSERLLQREKRENHREETQKQCVRDRGENEWKNEEGKFIGYKCKFKGDPLIYDVKKRHLKAPQLLS